MAETGLPTKDSEQAGEAPGGARSKDDTALELMKFIAVATGYGRAPGSSTGFSGKPGVRTADEQVDALLELFKRCRRVVSEP